MSVTVPNQTVAITRDNLPTPDFRRWQLAITDAVNTPAEAAPVEPVTGDYLPLSTYVRGVGGIAWEGTLEMGGVLLSLENVADSGAGALLGITVDAYGRVSGTTDATITGTAGEIDVANGDAVAGPPTLSLADVTNAGGGTLQKTAFDAKGRMSGTSAATASDVPIVDAGGYFTGTDVEAALQELGAGGGGGSGTVTSVGMTVPTGFAVTGSPVTTTGTLAVAYDTGYQGYTSAESTKLAGIASGATANSSDATLLARANHTGTQTASTISDFSTAVDLRVQAGIAATITNGDTTHAPSGDAVFDALALKADATSIPTYGSYTPTGSGVTNVTSVTGQPCNWFRHGNTVFLDGRVDVNSTAAGACVAFVSVPVASNFGAFTDAAGILVVAGTGITKASGTIIASVADDGFRFNFDGQAAATHQLYFHASYTVI